MRGNNFLVRVLCLSAAFVCFSGVTSTAMAEEPKCMEMEFEDVRSMAQEGDEDAEYCLANMYWRGHVIEQNIIEAEKLYAKLAEKGHAGALFTLSSIYLRGAMQLDGTGIRKDEEKGQALRKKAADAGHPEAMYGLGFTYLGDLNDPQGLDKAVELYTKAANKGHIGAAQSLANLYFKGHGLVGRPPFPVSKEKALFWYEKAAEFGSSSAQDRVNEMKGLSPATNKKKKKVKTIEITTASEKEVFFELEDLSEYLSNDQRSCTRAGYTHAACTCDLKDEYLEMEALLQEAAENHPEWVDARLRFEGKKMHTGEPKHMEGRMVNTSISTTWGALNRGVKNFKKYACSRED